MNTGHEVSDDTIPPTPHATPITRMESIGGAERVHLSESLVSKPSLPSLEMIVQLTAAPTGKRRISSSLRSGDGRERGSHTAG